MLWWMLSVDNWLDVTPLKNMKEDDSFLFLKKNLMKIFFFWDFWFFLKKIWKSLIFWRNWKFWLMNFFFFFFWKIWKSWIFFKELKILIDAMDLFIEMNWKYLANAPSLGHISCLDWSWIHLMLWPLGNMKKDHGPPFLVPTKRLSFSSLLETNYRENLHTI